MAVPLFDVVSHLDRFLEVTSTPDYPGAHNGLQVENGGEVSRVLAAVDASQASVDAAVDQQADLVVVHHGLFWDGGGPLVNRRFRRVRTLIRHGIAVYSSHLPLDRHPTVGNNALLAHALGLQNLEGFGTFDGVTIGCVGDADGSRADLLARLTTALGGPPLATMPFGPEAVRRVAIITGGAGSSIAEAAAAGADTFITGEGAHHTYFDAEELGLNVFYGGHYATETFGVRALGAHLEAEFGLPWTFFDHPTGL